MKHEKFPLSYIQDAKNFSVVKPLNSGEAVASPASTVPLPLDIPIPTSRYLHIIFIYTTQKNTRYNYNYTIYTKRKYIASTNLSFFNSSNYGTVGSMLSATAIRNLENFYEKFVRKIS